jgi:hypothetical protein
MISYRYYLHTKKELHVIKSCSGIVAALAVLFCCSWADAKSPSTSSLKLMADRPGSQGPEWVLYEDRNEDLDIVSFSQEGDSDGTLIVCQSDDGAVGSTEETQGGLVCRTASGAEESFYVLQLAEGVEDDGEAGGLAMKMQKKLGEEQPEMGDLPPFLTFEFTEEERIEMGEVLADTDAFKRMTEECSSADRPESCGPIIPSRSEVWRQEGNSRRVAHDMWHNIVPYWCHGNGTARSGYQKDY